MAKTGSNDLCPCGSGKKYKKCCRDTASLLAAAVAHHQANDIEQAVVLYTRVLERDCSQADALHGLGLIALDRKEFSAAAGFLRHAVEKRPGSAVLQHSLGVAEQSCGEWENSANSLARALAIAPESAQSLLRMGVALRVLGRKEDAAACFIRTAQIEPSNSDAHNNLGVIRQDEGRWEDAAACFRRAVELSPDSGESHNNLGAALRMLGRAEEAIPELRRAIELRAGYAVAQYNLALAWKSLNRREEAVAAFAATLKLEPDNESAAYFLHALSGDETPASTPAALVANLFDGYADNFDTHLMDSLGYRTPALLREAFVEAGGTGPLDILDVGCGTGLAGEAFRAYAGRLCGADLSPRMVEKARERGIYGELWVEDVLAALGRRPTNGMVVAADVFVYIGELDGIFAACREALAPDGWFLFSTESAPGETYVLSPSGRFQHPRAYIAALAARHGFRQVSTRPAALRQERGEPVLGDVYVLRLG